MTTRQRLAGRVTSAALAVVTVAFTAVAGANPAHALGFTDVLNAVQKAYNAYQKHQSNQLTLQQATTQIIGQINSAKTEILTRLDAMAASPVKNCAKTAVMDFADFEGLLPANQQKFAQTATECVVAAETAISDASFKGTVNQLGFALNSVGPIALLARKYTGLTAALPALKSTLVNANNRVISRLDPACTASPQWDQALPGGWVEVILRCTAFNGNVGGDAILVKIRKNAPLPQFNYDEAKALAMVGTSHQLAKTALPELS